MKSIAFVAYDFSVIGGVESVSCSLANRFCELYDVHFISICQTGELIYNLNPNISYSTLFGDQKLRLREYRLRAKNSLINYIENNEIDIVILEGNYAGFIGSVLKGKVSAKILFCDHGALSNSWWSIGSSFNDKIITLIRLISVIKSDAVVTLTEQSKMDYQKRLHIRENKVYCIPNWIEDNICKSDGYNKESKRIISAGRFVEEKGFDQLIKAFAPIAKKHPDWSLDIYGDGELADDLKNLVISCGLQNQVFFPGMVNNLLDRYKDYAMYVMPSHKEGLPLVLLEAKANFLPIISFDILTGPREIISDNIDGILVQEKDINALTEAMELLIDNSDLRIKMSSNSQLNIDKFSKDVVLKKWLQLFESI